jgi:hypothetical protein
MKLMNVPQDDVRYQGETRCLVVALWLEAPCVILLTLALAFPLPICFAFLGFPRVHSRA